MPNPFAATRGYARLSNIFLAPVLSLTPMPPGFILLTVTGRRSGKPRQRPVRAVRRGDTFYAIATLGERSDWLRNARKEPRVRVKTGRRTQGANVRQIRDSAERESAAELFVSEVFGYDYLDYLSLHWGWPTRRKIMDAHRRWLQDGVMVAIDVEGKQ